MEELIAEVLDGLDANESSDNDVLNFSTFVVSTSIFRLQTDLSEQLTRNSRYQQKR